VYEQATALVKASRERVWVTYLRKEGPTRGVAADNYFQECRKWAFESEDHDFRRIILRAAEPEIEEFCRQELVSIKQAARSNHKYRAKVLKSSFDWGEPLGIGIYDDVVFITYREAGEQVTGISLHSAELANGYFGRYFDSLWSPRCADHLQDVLK
jgi:hypothetical protein